MFSFSDLFLESCFSLSQASLLGLDCLPLNLQALRPARPPSDEGLVVTSLWRLGKTEVGQDVHLVASALVFVPDDC